MPQLSGFGGFMEGLQGGIAARDEMDMNRQYKRLLADKADTADREWNNRTELSRQKYMQEEGTLEGWTAPQRTMMKDPALMRFGKWLGSKMGFGGQQPLVNEEQGALAGADFRPSTMIDPKPQPAPTAFGIEEPKPQLAADGGTIRRGRGYSDRRRGSAEDEDPITWDRGVPSRPVETSGGGFGAYMGDVGREIKDVALDATYNTRRNYNEGAMLNAQNREYMMEPGISTMERGDRARSYVGDALGGAMHLATGIADDALGPIDEWAGSAWDFAKGFVGQDTPEELAGATPPTPGTPPDGAAGAQEQTPEKAATDATTPAPRQTDGAIADRAMEEGEQAAMENLDYKLLVDQGVRPEDLPSMTTQDWSDYRRAVFEVALDQGASPMEAEKQVDYMTVDTQMRGFNREANKALKYLQTGQNREAAMALRQAYQYFPNGVGVKFGMAKDPKTGLPAIIAMGTDEQTGEPKGTPWIITVDRLNAMVEQAQNPSAWRTWTQDGRDLQMEVAKLNETGRHNRKMEDIYTTGAITDRMNAYSRASDATSGGGMKYSDVDRRSNILSDDLLRMEQMGELPEGAGSALSSVADQIMVRRPDLPPRQVSIGLRDAFTGEDGGKGGEAGVIEYLERLQKKE